MESGWGSVPDVPFIIFFLVIIGLGIYFWRRSRNRPHGPRK
jgi:hypothetical protein